MKKQILFINGHLNTGGVEKSLIDVLQHLDYEKYDVDLLLLEDVGDYIHDLPPQVHVILHGLQNTYGPVKTSLQRCIQSKDWFCFRMRIIFILMKLFGQQKIALAQKILTENKHYDCVIGFRSGICTQIAAWAVKADRRITWWHHGEITVNSVAYEEAAQLCDKIAVVSDSCSRMLAEAFPALAEKLVTIPNMLDIQKITEKSEEFSPYPEDMLHIVSVGRLAPEKHFENLIQAAAALKEKGNSFCWHLIGDGPMRSSLSSAIQTAGLERYVILEGNQPNPYPYMKHANLFVHPSYVESQGIVVMEAMALGVPCVVTKSLGPCEFIQDGVNGILTEQSPESLTEKVLEILEDNELYTRIKDNTRCPDRFLAERVIKAVAHLLEG